MGINIKPIAFVSNSRKVPEDDDWGNITSEITLADNMPDESFTNIELFSHLEIIYYFNQLLPEKISFSRRPRGNPDYPLMGIFAQRNKDRPNSIGLCTVQLIEHNKRTLLVRYLDAIDGTPVFDIKPVFKEFQPKEHFKQPEWVAELMKKYW